MTSAADLQQAWHAFTPLHDTWLGGVREQELPVPLGAFERELVDRVVTAEATAAFRLPYQGPGHTDRSPSVLRVLFLAANPSTSTRLALDEEIRSITHMIRAAEGRDRIQVIQAWATRPDDLLQYLNQHQPDIVHFSGHGSAQGELVLTDDSGDSRPVSSHVLTALFRTLKDNVRLVLLNACYSRMQGVAIAEVIDYVVGMKDKIGDKEAAAFSASFYRALAFSRTVREAFDQACVAVMMKSTAGEGIPELLVRTGVSADAVLLEPEGGPASRP